MRVLGFVASPSIPADRRNTTYDGMVHATDWLPSYFSWVAASGAATTPPLHWPPPAIPGRPTEPHGFDGFPVLDAVLMGEPSPRTEVVHAVINRHNPPNYPEGPMANRGFPFSCPASSFCAGSLRRGDYKLLVGYPGWDEHYAYPNNNRVSPNTQLHWDVCKTHCLFRVGPGQDIAEEHDLAGDPAHAATLAALLDRFWALSNASGSVVADNMFSDEQCASAKSTGFWRPIDYAGPVPPPPPANRSGHWWVKEGRGGCEGKQHALGGAHLTSVEAVEKHCDSLGPKCVFWIWNRDGLSGGKAGDSFFCDVDRHADVKADPGWVSGWRAAH